MSIEKEAFLYKKSAFDELLETKKEEGWNFVAREGLTQTKFSKEAKFEEVPYQTEDSIKEKYLEAVRQQDPGSDFEIDLVLDENTQKLRRLREISTEEEYRNILGNLGEADRIYYVFIRKVKK